MSNTGRTPAELPDATSATAHRDGEHAAGPPPAPIFRNELTVVYGERVVTIAADGAPEERRRQRLAALSLIAQAAAARVIAQAQAQSGEPS